MRSLCFSAVAVLYAFGELPAPSAEVTLLTIPQRDRVRSHSSPPSASITADGRYLAFASYDRLAPSDDDLLADIYVIDSATGTVTIESLLAGDPSFRGSCLYPHISGDGRYVVFETAAAGAAFGASNIIFRDRITGVSRQIGRSHTGGEADGWSMSAMVSDDGRMLVFESAATNLLPEPDANGHHPDIYMVQTDTWRIRRVSLDTQGMQPAVGASTRPALSGDGQYVAFVSTSPLTSTADGGRHSAAQPAASVPQVYIRDLRLNVTRRINARPDGTAPNGATYRPTINRDGRFVAFVSSATNLVRGDGNRASDVFLHDALTGSITLVSRGVRGRPANGASGNPALSADGTFVAFQSDASDLVCSRRCRPPDEDINLVPDVFLFDRTTGRNTWISRGNAGGWMEESTAPVVDGSGRVVAFSSKHPADPFDRDHDFDLFVRMPIERARGERGR